jgi:putative ABC transport system substrate-binding protein
MEQIRRVGFLHSGTRKNFTGPLAALQAELPSDIELTEIWCDDDVGALADGAEELIGNPDLLAVVAAGGPDPALRLKKESERQKNSKSIIFTTVADPVISGLVADKESPGANVTGMSGKTSELDSGRLVMLHAFTGGGVGNKFGVLRFENRDHGEEQYDEVEKQAKLLSIELVSRKANTVPGIVRAFDYFRRHQVKGVVVTADSFFNNHRADVVAAAGLTPTIYQWKEFVDEGGMISYGPSILEAYKKAGEYVRKVVEQKIKPGNLPCSLPSAFAIHVNIIMAQKAGIKVPETIEKHRVRLV